jgi:hypothetical protein
MALIRLSMAALTSNQRSISKAATIAR